MHRSRYSWLGPLIVLLLIAGIGVAAARWIAPSSEGAVRTAALRLPVPTPGRADPPQALRTSLPVLFPPEALGEHPFVLDGAHAATDCEACHPEGMYGGTPDGCAACHADPHASVYGPDCTLCHDTTAFRLVTFDHALATDSHALWVVGELWSHLDLLRQAGCPKQRWPAVLLVP